ncbi:MAG: tetratricopeptide repeat protein [Bacteroidetes bacterium]|nr:tetratricopeptide repeat protein [Bacteroidota bacterium]
MHRTKVLSLLLLGVLSISIFQNANAQEIRHHRPSQEDIEKRIIELKTSLKEATTDTARVRLNLILADYIVTNKPHEGIALAKEALDLAINTDDTETIARSYFGNGNICSKGNKPDKALLYFEKGLPYAKKLGDPMLVNAYYYTMGRVYQRRGKHEEAIEHHQKGIIELQKMQSIPSLRLSSHYSAIANLYRQKGMYEKALEYFQKSLDELNKLPSSPIGRLYAPYSNIGGILNDSGKHRDAILYFEKSAKIGEQMRNWENVGAAWHNIAISWKKIGDIEKANAAYEKATDYLAQSKKKAISPPQKRSN